MPDTPDLEEMARERSAASDRVVASRAWKKLIVAGAGTGKTHTFKQALESVGGGGLALTFIRNLVRDLEADLSELADVFTFHGFCKHLVHRLGVRGISPGFDFYPPLPEILASDLRLLGWAAVGEENLKKRFQDLDETAGVIAKATELGDYYDAASFIDIVYRVLRHLEANPDETPIYPLVVVDEYQDFSRLETAFIAQLASRSPVLIAGDDDQALYTFKHASAIYIRELANDPSYERFELPYCSRCPGVIVEAVGQVIDRARRNGNLAARLDKNYVCFLPEKQADSEQHPKIIHAQCSVETTRAPYVCRYVADQIARIPPEDVQESHEKKYPTALVIGPLHFVRRVYAFLKGGAFPNATLRESTRMQVDITHGYRRLARNQISRLGWRILAHCEPFNGYEGAITRAVTDSVDLVTAIPDDYKARHLERAALIGRLANGEELDDRERAFLEGALARTLDEIQKALARGEQGEETSEDESSAEVPSIICTSLVGAKGLSAGYVFIVGFNNGHFPQHPEAITDEEVCQFVVGLSRTRKECHLVSCGRFAGSGGLVVSSFLQWIRALTDLRRVDRQWWE